MLSFAQKDSFTTKHMLAIFICLESALLLLLMKSTDLTILYVLFMSALFYLYHHPEFGLAIALTGRILLGMLYDHLSLNIPAPILLTYLVIALGGVVLYAFRHRAQAVELRAPHFWAALLFLILIVGLAHSSDLAYGKQKVVFYAAFNLLLILAPAFIVDSEKKAQDIFHATYFLGLILAIISTFIALGTPTIFRFHPSANVNPIWFSRSLGVSLLVSIYLIAMAKRRALKVCILATWPLFIYPMLRSWSRGPLLGVFICLIIFFYLQPSVSIRLKIIGGLFIVAAGLGLLFFTSNVILARLQAPVTEEISAAYRILAWIEAAKLFVAHPMRGIGTGSFFMDFPFTPFHWPHNIFLESASENGLPGLFSLCMLFLSTFLIGVKNLAHRSSRTNQQINIMTLTIFFYALWNAQVSGDISGNENIWLAAGLLCALVRFRRG